MIIFLMTTDLQKKMRLFAPLLLAVLAFSALAADAATADFQVNVDRSMTDLEVTLLGDKMKERPAFASVGTRLAPTRPAPPTCDTCEILSFNGWLHFTYGETSDYCLDAVGVERSDPVSPGDYDCYATGATTASCKCTVT